MRIRTFARNNGLSLVVFGIFFASAVGMSLVGWRTANNDLVSHKQPTETYTSYLDSGDFVEAIFENWESEFLQMWALVILTIFLRQKGSEDSKPMRGKIPQETSSRLSIIHTHMRGEHARAIKHTLYSHSLSLALLGLFIMSFILHAAGGAAAYSQENKLHGEPPVSTVQYLTTSQFWFESLQNWQSEFLSVGTLIVLSIKLRERGSPQSKPVGHEYDRRTGGQ